MDTQDPLLEDLQHVLTIAQMRLTRAEVVMRLYRELKAKPVDKTELRRAFIIFEKTVPQGLRIDYEPLLRQVRKALLP